MKSIYFLLFFLFIHNCFSTIIPDNLRINWNPGLRSTVNTDREIYTIINPGATTKQIQAAISNCPPNKIVLLKNGTYLIDEALKIPSYVTLKGENMYETIIKGVSPDLFYISSYSTNAETGVITPIKLLSKRMVNFDMGFDFSWSTYPAFDLVSPTKDSVNLTTSTTHNWSVGQYLIVDTKTNEGAILPVSNFTSAGTGGGGANQYATWLGRESGTRPCGQIVKITNVVNSTTVQIDPPLYFSYTNQPQAVRIGPMVEEAGLENLTLDNLDSDAFDTITVFGWVNCWVKNVKLIGAHRRAFWVYNALWSEISGCYLYGGVPVGNERDLHYTSDRAYPIFLGPHTSALLITDNISEKLTIGTVCFEGCTSGNVVSYNFVTNIWWRLGEGDSDIIRRFSNLMHGGHPFMNLIEGNFSASGIRADEYWGTSSHFTILRNRIFSQDRGNEFIDAQTITVDVCRRNHYWMFVGNILGGTTGGAPESIYECYNLKYFPYDNVYTTLFKLGYIINGSGDDSRNPRESLEYDTNVRETMIRWGNWSYRASDLAPGSAIVWDEKNVVHTYDKTIPNSFYLTSKPTFFGSLQWPPYDPYKPTENEPTRIPAGYRYYYGTNPFVADPKASYSGNSSRRRDIGPGFKKID